MPRTDTMRSFFAQQDHLGVLNYVTACLSLIGTSDQSCWLAEAYKTLLLLRVSLQQTSSMSMATCAVIGNIQFGIVH